MVIQKQDHATLFFSFMQSSFRSVRVIKNSRVCWLYCKLSNDIKF